MAKIWLFPIYLLNRTIPKTVAGLPNLNSISALESTKQILTTAIYVGKC